MVALRLFIVDRAVVQPAGEKRECSVVFGFKSDLSVLAFKPFLFQGSSKVSRVGREQILVYHEHIFVRTNVNCDYVLVRKPGSLSARILDSAVANERDLWRVMIVISQGDRFEEGGSRKKTEVVKALFHIFSQKNSDSEKVKQVVVKRVLGEDNI